MTTRIQNRRRIFTDRRDAGRALAERLVTKYAGRNVVVLGLPRGGVPVAYEVARSLGAPLDVMVVRKLGAPFNPEFALGAIAGGGTRFLNPEALVNFGETDLESIVAREQAELERRERLYRSGREPLDLAGKPVVLVDDGIATGSTMEAAVLAARAASCSEIIVAAPTASRSAIALLRRVADAVEVLQVPEPYVAVGLWYVDFPQLTDQEVVELLASDAGPTESSSA